MAQVWWSKQSPCEHGTVGDSDAAVVERLSRQLEEDIRQYRRLRIRRILRRLFLALILFAIIGAVTSGSWGPSIFLMIVFGGSEATDAHARSRRRTAELLARTRDPRAVNGLALALARDPASRAVASRGLQEILPTLKASDAKHITPEGLKALLSALRIGVGSDFRLMLAVLEALKQVGTPACIPAVQSLLVAPYSVRVLIHYADKWHIHGPGQMIRRLQESAAECLEVLRIREKEERDRSTLLRPAERPDHEDMLLLRPAGGARPLDDATLVTPAEPDAPTADRQTALAELGIEPDEVRRAGTEEAAPQEEATNRS